MVVGCSCGLNGGSGGTGGVGVFSSGVTPLDIDRALELPSSRGGGSGASSSTSVSTASSPGVNAEDTAKERLFGCPRCERSRVVDAPVIFEILKVEKRLEARRSSTSFLLSAANELAMAGGRSCGGVPGGGVEGPLYWSELGLEGSTTTAGGVTGLSTSE